MTPPLPCADDVHGPGFVQALAPTCLQVQWLRPPHAEAALSGVLTIAAEGGAAYQLRWRSAPAAASAWHQLQVEPEHHGVLADLLTLVRKGQHINICAAQDVEASDRYTGFDDASLLPKALPELAWDELDTRVSFLGQTLPLPLLITGMTGGLSRGAEINLRLARAAAAFGIPMGVGSQRIALDNPQHASIFAVKKAVPNLFLIGNLGMAQLRRSDALDLCRRAVAMIEADALAIHVNVLQEVIQVEGDRDFRGVLDRIGAVANRLDVPLIVKEVGGGIDPQTARFLLEAGVKAIDCGGKGGTSWSYIEGERASSPVTRAVANTFRDWGIPTAMAVAALNQALPKLPLVATGGIRDGLMVAKAIGLGASVCGIGLPLLRAALSGEEAPHEVLATLAQGLKTAMLVTGARTLADLRGRLHLSRTFHDNLARHTLPAAPSGLS